MIEIKPPNPVAGEYINVTVSGASGPCAITSRTPTQLIDNNPIFTLVIDCAGIGNFVPTFYSRDFQLGSLSAGDYTIIHSVINVRSPFSEQVSLKVTAVKDVPVVNPLGLVLLSILLLIMGKRFFKQKS